MPRSTKPGGDKAKTVTVWLWTCHTCGVSGMTVLTHGTCINCVHVRCPECPVEKVQIKASGD